MENKWFEFTIGLYVEAQTDEDAFRILQPVLEAANKLDPEGDAQCVLRERNRSNDGRICPSLDSRADRSW